jgi:hypothetical protein
VGFDVTDQLLIRFLHSSVTEKKMGVHQPFIDFKKANDSVKREVLYIILTDFGTPMKLVRMILKYV